MTTHTEAQTKERELTGGVDSVAYQDLQPSHNQETKKEKKKSRQTRID